MSINLLCVNVAYDVLLSQKEKYQTLEYLLYMINNPEEFYVHHYTTNELVNILVNAYKEINKCCDNELLMYFTTINIALI